MTFTVIYYPTLRDIKDNLTSVAFWCAPCLSYTVWVSSKRIEILCSVLLCLLLPIMYVVQGKVMFSQVFVCPQGKGDTSCSGPV